MPTHNDQNLEKNLLYDTHEADLFYIEVWA